jgi:hypothetical protein
MHLTRGTFAPRAAPFSAPPRVTILHVARLPPALRATFLTSAGATHVACDRLKRQFIFEPAYRVVIAMIGRLHSSAKLYRSNVRSMFPGRGHECGAYDEPDCLLTLRNIRRKRQLAESLQEPWVALSPG